MEKRCRQTKCGFFLLGGCKPCADCSSKPYVINTDCQRCMNCENEENELRWDDKIIKKQSDIIVKIKPKQEKLIEV